MTMTPENFDNFINEITAELKKAWELNPPTENEIMTKAIIDYQNKVTIAILNAIQNLYASNNNQLHLLNLKINELELLINKKS